MISVTIMQINTGVIVLYLVFPGVSLYENFQLLIPNGNRVPDPCVSYQVWNGVGHTSIFGGRARNPFGIDFSNAGRVGSKFPIWTWSICEKVLSKQQILSKKRPESKYHVLERRRLRFTECNKLKCFALIFIFK